MCQLSKNTTPLPCRYRLVSITNVIRELYHQFHNLKYESTCRPVGNSLDKTKIPWLARCDEIDAADGQGLGTRLGPTHAMAEHQRDSSAGFQRGRLH